ncbi:MAG: DNA-processing protein DprA [Tissierella sp.]|uniref:DNA-processing protein DprA n=1 Tax=Tissierella sp. TaxID=41274 RepID=UPI003F95AD3B
MNTLSKRDIFIWLNSIGISNKNIFKLECFFNDIREVLEISSGQLLNIKGIRKETLNKILKNRDKNLIKDRILKLDESDINIITILDKEYPESLINIYDKPYVLYQKGEMIPEDILSIAVVGSRKATSYGVWACEKFTKELVNLGVTIISGVALGIDTIAHKTALKEGGRTIGILGNGLDVYYPKRNESLYKEISNNGSILTEFPPGTPPLPYNFPQRNRIITGLSLGLIVIEAKERSGTSITAYHALEQGKDVFALPGNINSVYSEGTNKLISDGAIPLLNIDDILMEIEDIKNNKLNKNLSKKSIDYTNLSETEIKIIEIIRQKPTHCDIISYRTGISISNVTSILTILELKGLVKELESRIFALV